MTSRFGSRRFRLDDRSLGLLVVVLSAIGVGLNTDFGEPPRYDGAGYSLLAESLANGRGYREIDHPDAPLHAHFPPGYPLALAGLRRVLGRSDAISHAFSAVCAVGATWLSAVWFRSRYSARTALFLGSALALNWAWDRSGGAIRSESLYLLMSQLTLLILARGAKRPAAFAASVGLLSGLSFLVRHVGICLLPVAIWTVLENAGPRRPRTLGARLAHVCILIAAFSIVALPWILWLRNAGGPTQAELFSPSDPFATVGSQLVFYARRLPDLFTGPFVEIATVFRRAPWISAAATSWGALATGVVLLGAYRDLSRPGRRIAASYATATFALLLIWPFTEAGRFLVPLLPSLLILATEGIAVLLKSFGIRRARRLAAVLLLAAAIPYTAYALIKPRPRELSPFDEACRYLRDPSRPPGAVLARHPGDVFWQTGRRALAPLAKEPIDIDSLVQRYDVVYLLSDDDRFAEAEAGTGALERYAKLRPDDWRPAFQKGRTILRERIKRRSPDSSR